MKTASRSAHAAHGCRGRTRLRAAMVKLQVMEKVQVDPPPPTFHSGLASRSDHYHTTQLRSSKKNMCSICATLLGGVSLPPFLGMYMYVKQYLLSKRLCNSAEVTKKTV